MEIYYNQFTKPFNVRQWRFFFEQMPADIQERIRRYFKEENKYQLLIGRLLVKYGMNDLNFKDFDLGDIYYDENKCPRWKGGMHFNIAHSGNIVACAFSNQYKVGLDIEKIEPINLKDFDHVLNDIDHQRIANAENPYRAFFKIWTIKEAVTKAIGLGLTIDVQQIEILEDVAIFEEECWFYKKLDFDKNFAGHLVINKNNFDALKMINVEF